MRMELGLSQQQTIKQIQTLSPQMYMSMEILCLNSLDLEERIDMELENNETLDVAERTKEKGDAPQTDVQTREREDSATDAAQDGTDIQDLQACMIVHEGEACHEHAEGEQPQ